MSQAKVDRYKEEKRNRAKTMAKEKRQRFIMKCCSAVIALVLVGWAGFSVYDAVRPKPEQAENTVSITETFDVDTTALDEFMSTLN